ncbi:delta-1-pyrroline-5-carboxylate dehydrogenase [Desulfotomaculum arcticum]|uniref:L-glutamate gamma-semialdehyde dehydrogenase n=1 Tax=Desulfotruncus arcticus DSM 17038 TaxID=1121424 RepID=A0A1I2U6G3_9FIRM|nr:L-glutamate gamma-semialdehyde dehydrogenase [Desulfotruncus arcticus]SFG72613.1 delta-1-pyrroline-5-carboxylate dehydrogenase [Desulfotomaculum arcticum] [Desulfotruncus arcticus DSM 17038]
MSKGFFKIEMPGNEPVHEYRLESENQINLKNKLVELKKEVIEIPLIIGGKEVKTGILKDCVSPHNHQHVLARYHVAGEKELKMAIEASLEAKKMWQNMKWEHRAAIFLKAADLLAGPWRDTINAATMLGQSKTAHQAEIDSACELIDFLRFNIYFAQEIYKEQPISKNYEWNRLEYRPLEGFVLAITPFNFTAIGGNLPTAPAMLGNVVNWKPASTAVYSNYYFMKLLQEAGLPDGVINFIPSNGKDINTTVIPDENLAGIHFTGSSQVFDTIWKSVGENISKYRNYPRIVGETGGKDFVFAHNSCDVDALAAGLIRGAYEYQGQKCSAASRAYVPQSIWPELKDKLINDIKDIKIGDVEDFSNYVSAVIDRESFEKIKGYIKYAEAAEDAEIIYGGKCDDTIGYFIEPTIILASNPKFKTMEEEIFGPVLTIYVYNDDNFEQTLQLCEETSPYGLTGAIFAQDRNIIAYMEEKLYYNAGNLYINDKPTGSVVGQQPFGGSRKSGTNDKAGSKLNLLRWVSARTIKESLNPPKSYKYGFMQEK